jgi:effector-binding domain-containing protein
VKVELSGNVQAGKSPGGRAVRVIHRGPYSQMPASYAKLAAYMAIHGLQEGRVSWEQYISNPGQTDPEETVTHIYFMIRDDSTEQL